MRGWHSLQIKCSIRFLCVSVLRSGRFSSEDSLAKDSLTQDSLPTDVGFLALLACDTSHMQTVLDAEESNN